MHVYVLNQHGQPLMHCHPAKARRLLQSGKGKVESRLREKGQVEALLPASRWKAGLARFDLHKIVNPNVAGSDYQEGALKGHDNARAYTPWPSLNDLAGTLLHAAVNARGHPLHHFEPSASLNANRPNPTATPVYPA